jgi:hypothetical protein
METLNLDDALHAPARLWGSQPLRSLLPFFVPKGKYKHEVELRGVTSWPLRRWDVSVKVLVPGTVTRQ